MSGRGAAREARRHSPAHLSAVITGAQKAGTTSLLRYLAQHPELGGHLATEFTFFHASEYWRGWDWALDRYFYESKPGQRLVGKHATLAQSEDQLARLARHSPDCRVIVVLRDPVDRAFSSYRMERNHGSVVRSFEHILSCLDADPSDMWKRLFVDPGNYPAMLQRIHRHFDPGQVTVMIFEEFVSDPVGACQGLFAQLGLDAGFRPDAGVVHNAHRTVRSKAAASGLRWLRRRSNPIRLAARRMLTPRAFQRFSERLLEANRGLYSEESIDPATRARLARYYRPLNQQLEAILGRDLSAWSGMGAQDTGEGECVSSHRSPSWEPGSSAVCEFRQ